MKRFFTLCIVIILSTVTLTAQPIQPQRNGHQREHHGSDFQEFQMNLILRDLRIEDDETKEKFKAIYLEYSAQLKIIHPATEEERNNINKPSDELIEKQILDSFEIAEKLTALKKEYYPRYKEILTPKQILRMYNIERQIGDRINSEAQNRVNGNPPAQQERQRR